MVTSVGVSRLSSSLTRSLFAPGPLLLPERCCHELPRLQSAIPENANDTPSADHVDGRQTDSTELINKAAPRVSSCLSDASMALDAKRIEELCARLEQASAILHELLAIVNPDADAFEANGDVRPLPAHEAQSDTMAGLTGDDLDGVVELPQAFAAAA